VHLGQWTLAAQRVDATAARSPEDVVTLVSERVSAAPGAPVIGWGHRPGAWDREVTVSELDAVSGVTPVVMIAGDGHHGWLNSSALAALGLFSRDDVVRENEWFTAYERLNGLVGDAATSPAAYRRTLDAAAAKGVVGIVDAHTLSAANPSSRGLHHTTSAASRNAPPATAAAVHRLT